MMPGAIAFTRIPGASSRASARVRPTSPALLAAYADASGQPVIPHSLDTNTIAPRVVRRCETAARAR